MGSGIIILVGLDDDADLGCLAGPSIGMRVAFHRGDGFDFIHFIFNRHLVGGIKPFQPFYQVSYLHINRCGGFVLLRRRGLLHFQKL